MNVKAKVQALSDKLHERLDDKDKAIIADCQLMQELLAVRMKSGMVGADGQKTIKRMQSLINAELDGREKLILAHASAQQDAERMDFPFDCPPDASIKTAEPQETVAD